MKKSQITNLFILGAIAVGGFYLYKKSKDKKTTEPTVSTEAKPLSPQQVIDAVDSDPMVQAEIEQLGSSQGLSLVEPMSANGRSWDSSNL